MMENYIPNNENVLKKGEVIELPEYKLNIEETKEKIKALGFKFDISDRNWRETRKLTIGFTDDPDWEENYWYEIYMNYLPDFDFYNQFQEEEGKSLEIDFEITLTFDKDDQFVYDWEPTDYNKEFSYDDNAYFYKLSGVASPGTDSANPLVTYVKNQVMEQLLGIRIKDEIIPVPKLDMSKFEMQRPYLIERLNKLKQQLEDCHQSKKIRYKKMIRFFENFIRSPEKYKDCVYRMEEISNYGGHYSTNNPIGKSLTKDCHVKDKYVTKSLRDLVFASDLYNDIIEDPYDGAEYDVKFIKPQEVASEEEAKERQYGEGPTDRKQLIVKEGVIIDSAPLPVSSYSERDFYIFFLEISRFIGE